MHYSYHQITTVAIATVEFNMLVHISFFNILWKLFLFFSQNHHNAKWTQSKSLLRHWLEQHVNILKRQFMRMEFKWSYFISSVCLDRYQGRHWDPARPGLRTAGYTTSGEGGGLSGGDVVGSSPINNYYYCLSGTRGQSSDSRVEKWKHRWFKEEKRKLNLHNAECWFLSRIENRSFLICEYTA